LSRGVRTEFNRPFVDTHVWDKAAYDPVSDSVVLCNRRSTWTYDIARWEWTRAPEASSRATVAVSRRLAPGASSPHCRFAVADEARLVRSRCPQRLANN
jgi:hypothetical protein